MSLLSLSKFAFACGVFAFLSSCPGTVEAQERSVADIAIGFDNMIVGEPPAGFAVALTGGGGSANWIVESHQDATTQTNVVVQTTSEDVNYRFPLCVHENFLASDVDLSVRFRSVSGQIDQAAGLVWRYQDADNYYVVRANALEDNVVLYKMEGAKRKDLKPIGSWLFSYGKKAEVPDGQWSTLRIVSTGKTFAIWLNEVHLFDVEDETFQGAGKVGLWTKADSVTGFDDLNVINLD